MRPQVHGLGLLEHQHLHVGRKLDLNVQQIELGVVDQQDLEKQVVLVYVDEGLGVEGVEGTRELHYRLQLADVI